MLLRRAVETPVKATRLEEGDNKKDVHLADGAAISPVSKILATQMGCSAGIGKMCFTKNVFSSTTCQSKMNWKMATKRIQLHPGSSHRPGVQLSGVNCYGKFTELLIVHRAVWPGWAIIKDVGYKFS